MTWDAVSLLPVNPVHIPWVCDHVIGAMVSSVVPAGLSAACRL